MTNKSPDTNLRFLDNPNAPDVFADFATGFSFGPGIVRVTFEALRIDHSTNPGPTNRVVIGRLVMPIAAAEAMARGLLDFIEKIKSGSNADNNQHTLQ